MKSATTNDPGAALQALQDFNGFGTEAFGWHGNLSASPAMISIFNRRAVPC